MLQRVKRAGAEPERILSENELCLVCHVSLITVRRAIARLLESNYLMRLPGRKGAFTNPAYAGFTNSVVGIICDSGDRSYFTEGCGTVLGGFMSKCADITLDFEFLTTSLYKGLPIEEEMQSLSYDALLWFWPQEEILPVINRLLANEFPIVTIDYFYNPNALRPDANSIGLDSADLGVERAEKVLQSGIKNVAYLGVRNATFQAFVSTLKSGGVEFYSENYFNGKDWGKLKIAMGQKRIEGIVSDGGPNLLNGLVGILAENEQWRETPVFIESVSIPHVSAHSFLKIIPTLNNYKDMMKRIGEIAADEIKEILTGKKKRFEPVKVKVPR